MTTDQIEQGLIQVITEAAGKLVDARIHNDSAWTGAIFSGLTAYAYSLNLNVWSRPNEEDATLNECLYDLIICEGRTPTDIDKVWVVLESEWNFDFNEIKYDFTKLTLCRSMLRVMVFQSRTVNRISEDLVKLVDESKMSLTGDRYLFAGWDDDNGFTFRSHTKG